MKRSLCAFILFFLFAPMAQASTDRPFPSLSAATVQPADKGYSFIVLGDFRPSRRDRPYSVVFDRILEEADTIAPAFIVSTGDVYYGYGGGMQGFVNEVQRFLEKVAALGTPFFNVIGNHEVAADAEREEYLQSRIGTLYGSFDYGGAHFVLLDTDEVGREGAVTGEQLSWLERDLEANRDARHVFVFMHRPLFSATDPDRERALGKSFRDRENRDALLVLFKKHKVRTVFAGHEHLFSDSVREGLRQLITGGGGAPLYQSPAAGGFFHYLIVTVKGEEVAVDIIPPYALQTRTIAGNDGFEPKAELEVAHSGVSEIEVANLRCSMPTTAAGYRAQGLSISTREKRSPHPVRVARVRDNGDGTSSVSLATRLPKNGMLRITVEPAAQP